MTGDVDLECWYCAAPFERAQVERDGLLIPRRHDEGGPYLSFPCPRCRRSGRVERNRAGAMLASPRPIVPVVDYLLSLLDGELASELARKEEHARKRPGRRAWFFGPHADELIASGWRPPAPDPADPRGARRESRHPGEARGEEPRSAPKPPRDPAPPPPPDAPPPQPPPPPPDVPRAPHEVLGVAPGAPPDEVERAFRELAKRYHPDRFAVLDADFQSLAERRMRELLAARDALLPPAGR